MAAAVESPLAIVPATPTEIPADEEVVDSAGAGAPEEVAAAIEAKLGSAKPGSARLGSEKPGPARPVSALSLIHI